MTCGREEARINVQRRFTARELRSLVEFGGFRQKAYHDERQGLVRLAVFVHQGRFTVAYEPHVLDWDSSVRYFFFDIGEIIQQ